MNSYNFFKIWINFEKKLSEMHILCDELLVGIGGIDVGRNGGNGRMRRGPSWLSRGTSAGGRQVRTQ